MASLSRIIKEKGQELGGIRTEQVKIQQIHYSKLKSSAMNFYNINDEDVRELADNIIIVGGILEPLIVRKTDLSEYEILAGHKRKAASVFNVERGYKECEFLPCIVLDIGSLLSKKISEKVIYEAGQDGNEKLLDMIAEYIIICTNSTAREITPYEKMMQSVRLSEILPAMLEDGELKGRALRAEVAKEMKCGDGQVGRYQAIYNKLTPDAMKLFRDDKIPVTIAYGMSSLSEERQQALLKSDSITTEEIERLREVEKEEKEQQKFCEGQLTLAEEVVSETDTEYGMDDTDNTGHDTVFNPAEYVKVEWTYKMMTTVLSLILCDGRFPSDVLSSLNSDEDSSAQYFKDKLQPILPYENNKIRLEYEFGFKAYFKETKEVTSIPLYPLWDAFKREYNNIVNQKEEYNNIVNKDGTEPRIQVVNRRGYSKDDVEDMLALYKSRMKGIEAMSKANKLSKGDEVTLKKARIIHDGLTCLLDRYDEVKDRYMDK